MNFSTPLKYCRSYYTLLAYNLNIYTKCQSTREKMFSQRFSRLYERVVAFAHITNRASVSAAVSRSSNADVTRRSTSAIPRLGMSASCLFAAVDSIGTPVSGETCERRHPFAEGIAHSPRRSL